MIPLNLTDSEKIDYLTNLWLVVRADKGLSAQEKAVIEEVQKNIQAKKSLNNAAQKAAEVAGCPLKKVGSFADQVQNLEDMVAVALVDSDLSQAEGDLIISFCGLIGIQQEQLDMITSDVSKRLRAGAATISCRKCNAQISSQRPILSGLWHARPKC